MACQAFSADSFTPLALDSPLPILMHHASTSDCLPTTSHAHSMGSPGKLASNGLLSCNVKHVFFCVILFLCVLPLPNLFCTNCNVRAEWMFD